MFFKVCVGATLVAQIIAGWASPPLHILGISMGEIVMAQEQKGIIFYVSTIGNDSWSGRVAEPNKSKTDGPFASIEMARDAIREMRGKEKGLRVPVNVTLRGGTYCLDKTLTFTSQDSGTKECPITYQAYPGEKPIISGGKPIRGWRPFASTQGNLWSVKIPEVESGDWYFNQLFVNGERRIRARIPNTGYLRTAGPKGKKGFRYNKGDIKEWKDLNDAIIFLFHGWESSVHYISSIDTEKCAVSLKPDSNWPPGQWERKQRYYIENVFEGLDSPGEWYLNRDAGILYYYPLPGENMEKAEVIAPALKVTLLAFKGKPENKEFVEYLNFKGLSFQHTNANLSKRIRNSGQAAFYQEAAIMADGLCNSNFENCEIVHVGEHGIWLRAGCQDNRIYHCYIHDLGAGGIRIGSDNTEKEPRITQRNVVDNNLIYNGSLIFRGSQGVWIGRGSYNTVTHNDISDFEHIGISVGWCWGYAPSSANNNVVEYNHVHHIGSRIWSDMGAIYTLGISPGTKIRYNLIHDVESYFWHGGGLGIYLDEGSSDILVENNVVYNIHCAGFHQHYGKENMVRNNIFAFSTCEAISSARKEEHIPFTFQNNIIYIKGDCQVASTQWNGGFEKDVFDYNLYWNESRKELLFSNMSLDEWRAKGKDEHSIIADPLFVDAKNYDFRLKPNSPAFKIGFKPFDISSAGLYGESEWVNLPKKLIHRQNEAYAPEAEPEPIDDDFEMSSVRDTPDMGKVMGDIRVTAEAAASGKHSLKFVDGPGLQYDWMPHIYYNLKFKHGRIRFSCDIMNSKDYPGEIYMEFRDWRQGQYLVGPTFKITRDGNFSASGQSISTIPPGEWFNVEITFKPGDNDPKTYKLKLTLPKEKPQTFDLSYVNNNFEVLTWFGISSGGKEKAVFYVDNIKLEPVK